jgi:hypothetical protein
MLAGGGTLIIKHQMGAHEEVSANHFSESLNQNYSAVYRYVGHEKADLESAGFKIEIIDVYPKELNKWDNSHHYACVCIPSAT